MERDLGFKLDKILKKSTTLYNLSTARLVEEALRKGEGELSSTGALSLKTGKYTGRSPYDKFIVRDRLTKGSIAWGPVNAPFEQEQFEKMYERVLDYLESREELYVFDGSVGADPQYSISLRVINECAWQNLFARQIFIRPAGPSVDHQRDRFTVIAVPGLKAVPKRDGTNSEAFILISFSKRLVLIGGTAYAGEIKKSVFYIMNYLLPMQGILSMHCSANLGDSGETALFFGLSGTGKTTLAADPQRRLIGDDEHGWSDRGIFNLEGGCYAKCINLSEQKEPQIWKAIRFGTVLENVILDPAERLPDFTDRELTENTRAAYPLDYISGRIDPSVAGHPRAIIFLTADAFGVLPPLSILEDEQIVYHFISGYTSKLAGTERGVEEPSTTFSACFGEPFLPLHPLKYAEMLKKRVQKHGAKVYLINTGWSGGPYGVGRRIPLEYTRQMVTAALSGTIYWAESRIDPIFGLRVPRTCPGIPGGILNPVQTWSDPENYERKARELVEAFQINFRKKYANLLPRFEQAGLG